MSTSYYKLKEPITSIRIESNERHDKLTIFTRHGNAGMLVLDRGDGKDIARMFMAYDEDNKCPMRTHWGGKEGAVVTENEENLLDEMTVISEYGEILTVGDVRKRAGAKRKDGMPTELFGYED